MIQFGAAGYYEKNDPNLFLKPMFLSIWHILATFGCYNFVPLWRNTSISNEWFSLIQQKVSIFAEGNPRNWQGSLHSWNLPYLVGSQPLLKEGRKLSPLLKDLSWKEALSQGKRKLCYFVLNCCSIFRNEVFVQTNLFYKEQIILLHVPFLSRHFS